MSGNWLTINGSNILDPAGRVFYPFGSNHRWSSAKSIDGAYLGSTIGAPCQRIEFHWWEQGAGGDARQDGAPGNINPTQLALLHQYVDMYKAAGVRVCIAIHSKCGRSGLDDGTGLGAYCAAPDPYSSWPNGRNFWNDATTRGKWLVMLSFLATEFVNEPFVSFIEPLNEPDPTGFGDSAIANVLWSASDTIHAANPNVIVCLGGGNGYNPAKIGTVYSASRPWQAYIFDWFDQSGPDPDNPNPIADRQQSLIARIQSPLALRATGVPVWPDQFGSHYGVDTNRDMLDFSLAYLLSINMGGFQWEMRAANGFTPASFGFITDDGTGSGADLVRTRDEQLMQRQVAGYNSLYAATPPAYVIV